MSLGAGTTKFVSVPLHYFRAKRSNSNGYKLVSKFGESTLSLGQVTHEVYTSRDAHWTDVPRPVVT